MNVEKTALLQKVFDFSFTDQPTFDSFIVGANTSALSILTAQLPATPSQPASLLYLSGAQGSGCTHLLQAACHQITRQGLLAAYVSLVSQPEEIADIYHSINHFNVIAVDDTEQAETNRDLQEQLFHLFNAATDHNCSLIFAAHQPANRLNLELVDLRTRLTSCLLINLQPLSDNHLETFVKSLFAKVRVPVDNETITYMLSRYSRAANDLRVAVATLQRESLRLHKPITKAFVRSCLDQTQQESAQNRQPIQARQAMQTKQSVHTPETSL